MWTGGNHSGCIRRNFLTAVRWRGYVRGSRRTELETQMMTPDDFELWQRHQHDGEEVYDPTTGEICDAEEYLQAMGFRPVRVDHQLAPLMPGDNGRWEWLTVDDIKFLDSCGIEIDF